LHFQHLGEWDLGVFQTEKHVLLHSFQRLKKTIRILQLIFSMGVRASKPLAKVLKMQERSPMLPPSPKGEGLGMGLEKLTNSHSAEAQDGAFNQMPCFLQLFF
jgi:hypothetical protein